MNAKQRRTAEEARLFDILRKETEAGRYTTPGYVVQSNTSTTKANLDDARLSQASTRAELVSMLRYRLSQDAPLHMKHMQLAQSKMAADNAAEAKAQAKWKPFDFKG